MKDFNAAFASFHFLIETSPVCLLVWETLTFKTLTCMSARNPEIITFGANVLYGIFRKISVSISDRISLNGQLTSVTPEP